ncbi:MAG: tRNA threonylcarbamoyladenosine dehydratase [Candidatus Accumulibacter sp.]|jgi:tRNA A37 threonylcarbamoyladenosine dehydratase|nr:tRNA threonylcarbamoyladenosine dehydratase [Accumulibacter sp.]
MSDAGGAAAPDAPDTPDLERRFGGVRRLHGSAVFRRFQRARVVVAGLGGVGSWAAEALARSAIGAITLIDLDMVAESNVNRQIHALDGAFGKPKVDAVAARIRGVNPVCRVETIEDFVTPENVPALIGRDFDYLIDAIDQVRAKAAMIAWCVWNGLPLVTAGGAGGQSDPARIGIADLARAVQDPLLAKVRSRLRKEHGFTRDPGKKFGVPAVFSTEPVRLPEPEQENACAAPAAPAGLNCAGYGSSVCVTATFGLFAASAALRHVAGAGTDADR